MATVNKLRKVVTNIQGNELEVLLDQLHAIVYVCDLESYEILYMNKYAKEVYRDGIGKRCWEWLQPEAKDVCAYCSNDYLTKHNDHVHVRDYFNAFNDKWYEVQDKLIDWPNGKKVKLQIAYNIDHRKDDEKQLLILYRQQELFSKISTSFNKQAPFANKVNEVLQLVGNFVNTSRVSIYENQPEQGCTKLIYEWCKKGIKPKINKFPKLDYNKEQPVFKEIIEKKLLNANDLEDEIYREPLKAFRQFKTRAMLLIPIYLYEEHKGFISFEDCDNIRVWKNDEIQLINTFGNIISTSFERKSIEEQRIRSEHNLREANATKDKFFSIITRDLLTPFSDLTSLSSMLLDSYDKWDDEKRLKFISSIRQSSKNGYKILENLITWSKMQSGQIDFVQQEVDVRSVINLSLEQLKERADAKGIEITGVPEDFQFVMADYLMLNTIFKNLLNNAIKFSKPKGKIEIKLKKQDKHLEISICDNGIGIERKYLNNIFSIDLDNYSFGPIKEKGTGLGLIICREFVEKNGGQIWAKSELDVGSCFTFTVPLAKK